MGGLGRGRRRRCMAHYALPPSHRPTFEALFAKQGLRRAAVSGFGSAVGTLSSLVVKVFVALLMIVWFFVDVFLID